MKYSRFLGVACASIRLSTFLYHITCCADSAVRAHGKQRSKHVIWMGMSPQLRPILDNVLNITWLANANYALTSAYDNDGLMHWGEAKCLGHRSQPQTASGIDGGGCQR